ncbi:uncharacterized protein LOC119683019 isoform X1 [Teleopsis dalmanni]|uniref:uncharacterized protein LOC119683019 isoform X1 n=1 Tax=Teleopsis dalmanni TaxID=139649 RepID=UPI0018CFD370|nr:uncharacterized protein LOC119683019 isoform X1 [Teleopsis dalmanni]
MLLKSTWCAFILRLAFFSVVVKLSRQHPQNAATSQAQLETDKHLYELNIKLPDNSFRNEIAQFQTSKNSKNDLSVTGFIDINFIISNAIANWSYTADKNGFLARYIYKHLKDTQKYPSYTSTTFIPTRPSTTYTTPTYPTTRTPATYRPPTQSLSPNALKSSGG